MPEAEEGDEGDEGEGGFGVAGGEGGGVDPGDGGEEFADGGADGSGWVGAHLAEGAVDPEEEADAEGDGEDFLVDRGLIAGEKDGADEEQEEGPGGGFGGGCGFGFLAGDEAEADDVGAEG